MTLPIRLTALSVVAACLPAQSTLLYVSRYNSQSLEAKAGELANVGPFDIAGVTPGKGATAFPWIPAAGISALIGDANNDGKVAEFTGLPHSSFGLAGLFVKDADRKSGDPRKLYWTVRVPLLTPPKIDVFSGNTVHTVRPGDFVRLTENGEVEFFMKQEHFVKAMGPQRGAWVEGAGTLCQAANGDLFYSPPNAINKTGTGVAGGHWVNQPTQTWCNDGAICIIRNKDITYDKNGNVKDVKASSSRVVIKEVGSGPNAEASVRTMCQNSGALDGIGKKTSITFTMIGLAIDPRGGTFDGWFDAKLPNLIWTFNNPATSCCGGPFGSWHGTVFSTAKNKNNQPGSVAVINGVSMGTTTGKGDGSWLGLKQGSGHASAPIARGLAIINAGFKSPAPYGNATLTVPNQGTVDFKKDPNVRLTLQGPAAGFPSTVALGFGMTKGGRPSSFDFSGVWKGFRSVHIRSPIVAVIVLGAGNTKGQSAAVFKVPNDPKLIGLNAIWQSVSVSIGGPMLSNPVVTEIR